jgi:hypothetical protein
MSQKQDLSFLLGRTEAEAYELAQDHGFVVRITQRDDKYFIVTYDMRFDRVNFVVQNNRVTKVHIG